MLYLGCLIIRVLTDLMKWILNGQDGATQVIQIVTIQFGPQKKDLKTFHEVDAITGAFFLTRKSVLDKVGLFDEDYFMYGEDLDWCLRTQLMGWTVRYEPDIVVQHQHGASSRKRALRTTYHFFRAMDLFYRKHYIGRYHPLVTGAVRTAIYGALALAMCRTLLTSPSERRVGL